MQSASFLLRGVDASGSFHVFGAHVFLLLGLAHPRVFTCVRITPMPVVLVEVPMSSSTIRD